MSARCTAEPISFLRFERYVLAELSPAESARIDGHLRGCEACRQCLRVLQESEVALPPLPRVLPAPGRRLPRGRALASALFATAAAAAALVLALRGTLDPGAPDASARVPGARVQIKGGELAIDLVRERAGDVALDPSGFREGDRFQVRLTCPPSGRAHADFVVFQAGQVFFPLAAPGALACGNLVSLPGAFRLTGKTPAVACVVLDAHPIDRAALAGSPLGKLPAAAACRALEPSP